MFILTRASDLENSKDNILVVSSDGHEGKYLADGYKQQERIYKLRYQRKEYIIICPEFRNDKAGFEPVVIIPEFLIPGRPYPVEVYMYAIDLYCNNPRLGQRTVAESTRQRFGLNTFSHTTLGRALKRFVWTVEESVIEVSGSITEQKDEVAQRAFPSKLMTKHWRRIASQHLQGRASSERQQQASDFCHDFAWRWFAKTGRFLL